MAIKIPIITELQDAGIKAAKREFDKFKGAIADAEGVMGKFKAAGTATFDALKRNAGKFAAAVSAMAATFAVKSLFSAQQLAIEAGKFADATGLTVEQASRFKEVAGDIGIEQGTVETAIGKMNKVLGKSPELFQQLGVEVARTRTGAVDANETFLNVVDRLNSIKDPAERARVATELLGKGWQGMSELIGQGSDKLRTSLKAVSDQKVVTDAELEKARKLRQNMDELSDKGQDLALTIGQDLIPIVIALADALIFAYDAAKKLFDVVNFMPPVLEKVTGATYDAFVEQKNINDMWREGYDAMLEATKQSKVWDGELDNLADTTYDLNYQWERLLGNLDRDAMFRNATEQVQRLEEAAIEAFADPTKYNAFRDEMDRTYQTVAGLLQTVQATNDEQNKIKLMVDTGQVERAIKLIQIMNLRPGTSLAAAAQHLQETDAFLGTLGIPARASGGSVGMGSYLVGERGPEILTLGQNGGFVTPLGGGSGSTINVTVTSADPNEVVRALRQYIVVNGSLPIAVR